jgi:hypothetical protein
MPPRSTFAFGVAFALPRAIVSVSPFIALTKYSRIEPKKA